MRQARLASASADNQQINVRAARQPFAFMHTVNDKVYEQCL